MGKTPLYKIIISERTRQMLGGHVRFMAEKSPSAAREVQKSLMNAIRSLCQMPNRFPFFEEEYIPPNKYHKMFVEKWYLILYQVKDQTVYVDYILDCRQDYGWLVK